MNIPEKWLPRSILCLRNYTLQQLTHDLVSGITAGLVALPLAMAFGIAPGVTPQAGLYTAVVGGFLISALGGSHTQIRWPDGCVCGHCCQIWRIRSLSCDPHCRSPVDSNRHHRPRGGGQVHSEARNHWLHQWYCAVNCIHPDKDFLGLHTGPVPSEFLKRMDVLITNLKTTQWQTATVACASLSIILLWPRWNKRIPGSIVALSAATLAARSCIFL